MAVAINVTTQAVYPPRNSIALTGLTVGDEVSIFREIAGSRTLVRSGYDPSVAATGMVVVDAELPFGVLMRYVAVVNDVAEYATTATSYALPGGKVVVSDAINGIAAEVMIMASGGKAYGRDSSRFRIGGRNLMVAGPLGQAEGTYDLYVETTTALTDLLAVLANATEATVQLRQPGGYDGVDAYLAVDKVTETRYSQDGSDQRRLITVEYAEVSGWDPTLQAQTWTYGDVEGFYSSGTYGDAAADYATYLDALQGDFS